MESRASLCFLALLLGFSQALYLNESMDMTARILTNNKGSWEQLVEGDILMPRGRNALVCPSRSCFWPKSSDGLVRVPYILSSAFSSADVTVITNAMASFRSKTCISFVPRTNETDYVNIVNGNGCYSNVGKIGGAQVVSLSIWGCVSHGVAEHELNHVLGFYHEHTRSDRNSYVTINWANIIPSMDINFNMQNTDNLNTPYDYSSVMHYGNSYFSVNGLPTITPIPNPSVPIGQRTELSTIDVERIKILYSC